MTREADWKTKAACRNHPCPDLWFPDTNGGTYAEQICKACPVRRQCGEDAVKRDERYAIVAGFRCSASDQRDELRVWLGLPGHGGNTKACRDCGQAFETKRPNALCPACRDCVDTEPVRRWVEVLRAAGMQIKEIAAAADVATSTIHGLRRGSGGLPWRTMARDRAERILAVPVPQRVAS
ncbi:WhiB family transcriptional regulator [Nocardia sp. NPDC057440]|uniref:WhiB family transcriptional regulator n=1 Tax=Nocardia sp. NPDC057440 TaxID=3346134 RepID=UPI00366E63AD